MRGKTNKIYFDTFEWNYWIDTKTVKEREGGGEKGWISEKESCPSVSLKLWNNGALVYNKGCEEDFRGGKDFPNTAEIVVKEKDSNSFNIKMTNLKKGKPAAANYIYQEDGYLKIS